ncbi:MAG: hypothetical protein WBO92_04590 [Candidatus Moraniibacteriota bacterium]
MAWSTFGQKKKSSTLKAGKSGRYYFTLHSEYKMREYHLSRQRVIRIIRSPQRTETGIVENTVAVMQPASTKRTNGKETWSQELWVMYKVQSARQESRSKNQGAENRERRGESQEQSRMSSFLSLPELKIISAWRYPGVSPERDPIPADILREIARGLEESELAEEMALKSQNIG